MGNMNKRGFTMVEVLVVITIIAVLSALGMGAVRSGMARAKQVHCASNMRQIGVALTAYAGNNNGFFPETTQNFLGFVPDRFRNTFGFCLETITSFSDIVQDLFLDFSRILG